MAQTFPTFALDSNPATTLIITNKWPLDNAKYVSTIQSVADAAAMQLISEYANKIAVWSKSEEAILAAQGERTKMLAVFNRVFSEGKYVLLRQRESSDYDAGAKRLKITKIEANTMEEIGECRDTPTKFYELAGGRMVCSEAATQVDQHTFNYGLMEQLVPANMQRLTAKPSALIADPHSHEYQLRHYLLNMCQFVTQHMQGSTLENTQALHKQIELTDMHSSHTVSSKAKRNRDARYVIGKAQLVLYTPNNNVHTATATRLWVVKPANCEPYRMTPYRQGATGQLSPEFPDAVCTCTSDDYYAVKYGVFYSTIDQITYFALYSASKAKWVVVAKYNHANPALTADLDELAVNFWEVPSNRHVRIDHLTDKDNFMLKYDDNTDVDSLVSSDKQISVVVLQAGGVVAAPVSCKYLSGIVRPSLQEALNGNSHYSTDTVHQTVRFVKGVDQDADEPLTVTDDEIDGYELVPVPDDDVALYSTSMNIPCIQFANDVSKESWSWFIGGMPTLALDGLMAAALITQHTQVK